MGCEKEPKKKASVGRVRKVYICMQTNNYYINNGAEKLVSCQYPISNLIKLTVLARIWF